MTVVWFDYIELKLENLKFESSFVRKAERKRKEKTTQKRTKTDTLKKGENLDKKLIIQSFSNLRKPENLTRRKRDKNENLTRLERERNENLKRKK